MPARLRTIQERFLPHGPLDIVRQFALFWLAYYTYRLTRGLADEGHTTTAAFQNARDLIDVERAVGIFVEPSVQTFASSQQWLMDGMSWMYLNAQSTITVGALGFIYLFRNSSFYFVRNMFIGAFLVAMAAYTFYPTAPPRFLPEWGFFDPVSAFTGVEQTNRAVGALLNPYAAVPSMHVAFALMIGWPLARLLRWRALKIFWMVYPLLITFVIVATANHFIVDAILGAGTAALGALGALGAARLRPDVWSFRPPRGEPETEPPLLTGVAAPAPATI